MLSVLQDKITHQLKCT